MTDETKENASADNSKSLEAKLSEAVERAQRFEAALADREKQIERYKSIDPDEFHALKQANEQLQREKAQTSPEELDAWKSTTETKLRDEFQKTIDEKQTVIDKLSKQNHALLVTDKAVEELRGRFTDDGMMFVRDLYIKPFVDRDDSGEFVIKGEDGKVRYAAGQASVKMSLAEFAAEIAEKHPSIARAESVSGGKTVGQKISNNSVNGKFTIDHYNNNRAALPVAERQRLAMEKLKKAAFRQ